MKRRFTEEQIIGFLREADAGLPVIAAEFAVRQGPHFGVELGLVAISVTR